MATITLVLALWTVEDVAAQDLVARLRGSTLRGMLPLATGSMRRDRLASPIGAKAR